MKSSGYVCCSHQQVNARQFLSVSSPIPYTPSVARIVGRSWVKRASPKRGDHQIERIVFNLKEPSSSGTSGTLSHLPATGSDVDKRLARITFGDKRGDILTGNLTDSTGGSIIVSRRPPPIHAHNPPIFCVLRLRHGGHTPQQDVPFLCRSFVYHWLMPLIFPVWNSHLLPDLLGSLGGFRPCCGRGLYILNLSTVGRTVRLLGTG